MKARDVMVSPVITVKPSSSVRDLAQTLVERHISAVPVVDDAGKLIGIVSEGDLMHRAEADTQRRRSWWLRFFSADDTLAAEYAKAHAKRVADVMTKDVITASPETPLHQIAVLLEKHAIKRVPIVENGQLVGIVSRANLVQAVATGRKAFDVPLSDGAVRDKIMSKLNAQPWAHTTLINVTVSDGVVDLWGLTRSETERKAIRVAAESTDGVRTVNDHLSLQPVSGWA